MSLSCCPCALTLLTVGEMNDACAVSLQRAHLAKLQMEDAMQRVIEKRHAMDDAMHSRTQQ